MDSLTFLTVLTVLTFPTFLTFLTSSLPHFLTSSFPHFLTSLPPQALVNFILFPRLGRSVQLVLLFFVNASHLLSRNRPPRRRSSATGGGHDAASSSPSASDDSALALRLEASHVLNVNVSEALLENLCELLGMLNGRPPRSLTAIVDDLGQPVCEAVVRHGSKMVVMSSSMVWFWAPCETLACSCYLLCCVALGAVDAVSLSTLCSPPSFGCFMSIRWSSIAWHTPSS